VFSIRLKFGWLCPPVAVLVLVICAGIYFVSQYVTWDLFQVLSVTSVVTLNAAGLLGLVGLLLEWEKFQDFWRNIDRSYLRKLGGLLVITTTILLALVPKVNRILFDEHLYESIGMSIAENGKAFLCNDGQIRDGEFHCPGSDYNKEPNGYPFYLSFFFRVFGSHEWVAHFANTFVHLAGGVLVFWLIILIKGSGLAALFGSAFFLLTPETLIWARTAAVEPSATTAGIAAVLSAFWFRERRTWGAALFFSGIFSIAIQFRMESVLILLPILWILLGKDWNLVEYQQKLVWAVALISILTLSHGVHLWVVRHQDWGSTGAKFSLEYFFPNLKTNGLYFLSNKRYPLVIFLFAIGAQPLSRWAKSNSPVLSSPSFAWLWLWIIPIWGIFLFFYAGSYEYGADSRFASLVVGPLSILAGLGVSQIFQVGTFKEHRLSSVYPLVFILVLSGLKFIPLIRRVGIESWEARGSVEFIQEAVKTLPKNAIVFTHVPSVWMMQGQSAAQASVVSQNPNHLQDNVINQYNGGAYFHWDYWCEILGPHENEVCNTIRSDYENKLVLSKQYLQRKYALYQILPKSVPIPEKLSQRVETPLDEGSSTP